MRTQLDNGAVQLLRATPAEVEGNFDVVMAHHAFEHMADPHGTMGELRRLARRRIVLSMPVPGFGWREYGMNWAGLDPPRHLHIPTVSAVTRLAESNGLRVTKTYFEPDSLYLWCSEQWAADIPLFDPRSFRMDADALTAEQVAEYDRRARELAAAGDGDVAVFLLEPA